MYKQSDLDRSYVWRRKNAEEGRNEEVNSRLNKKLEKKNQIKFIKFDSEYIRKELFEGKVIQ